MAIKYIAGGSIGGGIGYLSFLYENAVAHANVAIRPEIADVDFITAMLAEHGSDWILYNHPSACAAAFVGVGALVGIAAASSLR